jgi:hypothetical protein
MSDLELCDLPRKQPHNEETNILSLPTEILRIIIHMCSTSVISRQCINMTCTKFRDIVTSLPQHRLYINPYSEVVLKLHNITNCHLSVQKLLSTAGEWSGLSMIVRNMIQHPLWDHARIHIQREGKHGWFIVKRAYWLKEKSDKKHFIKK